MAAGLLCAAANEQTLEYQVKAAFLLNFTKFVEWPAATFQNERSPIAICVLGDDPFGGALSQIVEGEVVNGRRVIAQRIRRPPQPKACQVLFVNNSEKDVRKILADLGPGVLTVGEGEPFLDAGGMITFIVENRRVRFDINQSMAVSASVTLSSKLLSVARAVKK